MSDLKIFHNDNGVYLNYSRDLADYLRNDVTIDYTLAEDFIYIGLYKPFNSLFAELTTPIVANMSAEYWNGSSYQSLNLDDDSVNLSRSGFIKWNKPSDWSANTVNSENLFYIRLSFDASVQPVFKGLNIVFSDDQDLLKEVRDIMDFRAAGDSSFIAYHVSSRDQIVQTLRNGGDFKRRLEEEFYRNLTKWDLLDIGEIRQASKFLTLSKIFFDVSENNEDKAYIRYRDYLAKFGEAFKLFRLSLDKDDDGEADRTEILALNEIVVTKL